ncbi:S-layer homology domain-containing protein [Tumebacillus permanentifrigoris]|uniref:S-layer family protein n=1 Tax=Tumebacillus permanentifrigoris TaxID=378543 RepID=A0A316D4Z3_9BACL|nr:S-layer homology domain-containing protein [Tumebacillus permanentifrigoris]PWK05978.1 S-layer family protein [Tumebacillus permanentifrigoris]
MKKKLLAILTGAALLTSTISVPAFAATSKVTLLDISNKHRGDVVTITGTSSFSEVVVKIISPDGLVMYVDNLYVAGGQFSKSITLSETTQFGTYTVVVGQGTEVQSDLFTILEDNAGGGGGGSTGGGTTTTGTSIPGVINQGQTQAPVKADTKTDGNKVLATVSDADLAAALKDSSSAVAVVVSIPTTGTQQAQLTLSSAQLSSLSGANTATTFVASTGVSSVALPVSVLKKIPAGASINIVIGQAADSSATFTNQVAGATVLSTPVSFEVNVVTGTESAPIDLAGQDFVKRSFLINGNVDTATAGVLFIENGSVRSVPATFTKNADGTITVTVNRPGFSTYAVASRPVSFSDIGTSYAQDRIQSLASKFLLYGTSTNTFSPEQNVTRAEFAAMLVRALGLQPSNSAPFSDVAATDWFAQDVASVYEAGLVNGVGNGQFDPNADISRQDLTVMLSNAIKMLNIPKKQGSEHVEYVDASGFASYAKDSIATVTESGLMTGEAVNGTYSFHPTDSTTREAAATVLFFLLQNAKLIN